MAARLLPLVILLVLGAIWGGGTSVNKFISLAGVPPIGAVFWQTFGAGVILLLVARLRGARVRMSTRHLRYYVVAGLLGIAIPASNMVFVLGHIPAGTMAVIVTLAPLLTYLGAMALRMEAPSGRRAGGIALGLAGALVLILPGGKLPAAGGLVFVLMAFITPACYSAGNIYADLRRPTDSDSLSLAAGTLLAAAAVLFLVAVPSGRFHGPWADFGLVEVVIIGYSGLTAIAFLLFFVLLRLAGPVYLSQVAYIITVTGIGWGMLVFAEQLNAWIGLAVALIFGGVALVNSRPAVSRRGGGAAPADPDVDSADASWQDDAAE